MQKKHGIIVGVTILAIALIVTIVSSMIEKRNEGKSEKPSFSVTEENKGNTNTGDKDTLEGNKNGSEGVINKGNTNTSKPVETDNKGNIESDITNPNKNGYSIVEVPEDTVLNPTSVENEVMIVASKKVLLIDMEVGSNENKQMVYVLDMLSADSKKVSLYVNGVVYDDIKVGDALNIQYNKYVNKNGVEVPLVLQATKVANG